MLGCRRGETTTLPGTSASAPVVVGTSEVGVRVGASEVGAVVLDGLLELPLGFRAAIVQRAGDVMSDGHTVPEQPDGMTCYAHEGAWVLLRNHELGRLGTHAPWPDDPRIYDPERRGAVTRVIVDPHALRESLEGHDRTAIRSSNLVLGGTDLNCAGGPARVDGVDGWISCEESDAEDHGFAFWTRVDDAALVSGQERRLTGLGRFKREAVALDPTTGVLYMTEDHVDGLIYRHVPEDPVRPFGAGRLEALRIPMLANTDPREGGPHGPGEPLLVNSLWSVEWVPIADPLATSRTCREQGGAVGASRFNRCEGITRDPSDGAIVFVASLAGPVGAGQIYRLDRSARELTLIAQVDDRTVLSMPDNLVMSPWGELVLCEDNYDRRGGASHQHVRVLGDDGRVRTLIRNLRVAPPSGADEEDPPGAELAGACFSPDGEILFVNVQRPEHVTVAITGDWSAWRARS